MGYYRSHPIALVPVTLFCAVVNTMFVGRAWLFIVSLAGSLRVALSRRPVMSNVVGIE